MIQKGLELYRDGRYGAAEAVLQEALRVVERNRPDHPNVAVTLNYLSQVYRAEGRLPEAEEAARRALEIQGRSLERNNPEVSASLNNLAEIDLARGKGADAEALAKRSLELQQGAWGGESPQAAVSLNNLAGAALAQGRLAEAEQFAKQAISLNEKLFALNDPESARLFGFNYPYTATSMAILAEVYQAQGRFSEAEATYKRALAIQESSLGSNHSETANTLEKLAGLYVKMGKSQEAEQLKAQVKVIRGK